MSTSNVIKFLSDYFNFYKNIFKHLRDMEIKDIQQNIQYNAKQKTSIRVYILQKKTLKSPKIHYCKTILL